MRGGLQLILDALRGGRFGFLRGLCPRLCAGTRLPRLGRGPFGIPLLRNCVAQSRFARCQIIARSFAPRFGLRNGAAQLFPFACQSIGHQRRLCQICLSLRFAFQQLNPSLIGGFKPQSPPAKLFGDLLFTAHARFASAAQLILF